MRPGAARGAAGIGGHREGSGHAAVAPPAPSRAVPPSLLAREVRDEAGTRRRDPCRPLCAFASQAHLKMQHQLLSQLNQVVLPAVGDSDGTSEATVDVKAEAQMVKADVVLKRPLEADDDDGDDEDDDDGDDDGDDDDGDAPKSAQKRQRGASM